MFDILCRGATLIDGTGAPPLRGDLAVTAGRIVAMGDVQGEAREVVEADSDLGVGAVILPGVRIGRGAQIGAGAVVTRDVPPFAVAAGNPARVLRFRGET